MASMADRTVDTNVLPERGGQLTKFTASIVGGYIAYQLWKKLSRQTEMDGTDGDDNEENGTEMESAALRATRSEPAKKHKRDSHLFRNKSARKWNAERLDQQQKEMQNQMVFLLETRQQE